MLNSNVKQSLAAGGIAFALCLVSMLAGGTTWGTGAAGWLVFLALVFSAGAGLVAWHMIRAAGKERWLTDRNDTIDRLNDAQRCIKAEESAHERTKRELADVRQQVTRANEDASTAKREYEAMRERAAQRGRTIDELQKANFSQATENANKLEEIRQQVQKDNDTWRKQVSNMRTAALNLYCALDTMKFNNDDLDAVQNLMDGLRELAEAGGVPEVDARQVTIDEAIAEPANPTPELVQLMGRGKRAELPEAQTQPTPIHIAHQLMDKVRADQTERRANLDRIVAAVEQGYELSDAFNMAYHRGMIWVSDELIANECQYIDHWTPSE